MRLAAALLATCLCSASACADIQIGIAGPLAGPNAAFGAELRNGVSAAITAINASGGVNGEPLALVEGDDNCDARKAVDVAKDMVSKDVRLVVGHFCSSASLVAAPTYLAAGIVMVTPSAAAPDLTRKSLWNVFRLTGRDDFQADFASERIKAEGLGAEVILLTDGQPDTADLATRFKNALPNAKVVTLKPGQPRLPDDAGLVTATAAYFALSSQDAGVAVRELRKLNATAVFLGPDTLQSEAFGKAAGDAAEGAHFTFLQDGTDTADARRAKSVTVPVGATLAAYAAVEMFVAAAKAGSVNNGKAMAGWLAAGNSVDTIVGTLRFNASGDLQQQPYVWYSWRGGVPTADAAKP